MSRAAGGIRSNSVGLGIGPRAARRRIPLKTGRQWWATGVAPADFIRTRRSQAWPASSPTIHYTGCLNYSLFFFPVSYSYLRFNTTGTLSFCGWSRSGCAWDVTTISGRRWRHNRKYESIIVSWYQWDDFFLKSYRKIVVSLVTMIWKAKSEQTL